ncbi:MAG: DNA-binding protein, partial [Clostridia bacterium]|nr:DNA-binding protein [Clostridia bacterium]
FLIFLFGMHYCLKIEKTAGYYECEHCHHKYFPEYKIVFLAPHIVRTRYMRCPHCNEKSWNKKVISK